MLSWRSLPCSTRADLVVSTRDIGDPPPLHRVDVYHNEHHVGEERHEPECHDPSGETEGSEADFDGGRGDEEPRLYRDQDDAHREESAGPDDRQIGAPRDEAQELTTMA
jgi:hypothetical protein